MIREERRPSELLTGMLQWLVDRSRVRSTTAAALVAAAIAVVLLASWLLVYGTNGTSNVFLHVMYVPIIVASMTLGLLGGAITAVAAGALMGPLMPLDVDLGLAQPLENTIYRTGFFLLVALVSGAFAESTRRRHAHLVAARAEVSEISSRNLRLFARLVAERDEQTAGHCERVAHNTVVVARALGIEDRQLKRHYWAGILHDLGKLGVPEHILRKPGRLTSSEFDAVKRHPAFGEGMLLDISESFRDIAQGVRSHHERWDGSGYPDGLAGEAIPLIGRILAVVDVYEAVTSHRPYRGPMPSADARGLIRDGIGTHFDPEVASLFLALERDGLIVREREVDPLYPDMSPEMFSSSSVLRPVN